MAETGKPSNVNYEQWRVYNENHEYAEIHEWVDVWEYRNGRLPTETREAMINAVVLHAKGGPYQGFEGEKMLSPLSAWRLAGVVTDVLTALKEGGVLNVEST